MNESDFPQFPDPRVRAVFAAAANLVEAMAPLEEGEKMWLSAYQHSQDLKTALFAAQHSQPKSPGHQPQLANFCDKCGHIAWLVHLKEGLCLDCQASQPKCGHDPLNSWGCLECAMRVSNAAQHSKPKEDEWKKCDCKPGCTRVVQHNPKVLEEYMKRDRHYLEELRPMIPQKLPIQEPSPNPCGGDHGNSYECHACQSGRKV